MTVEQFGKALVASGLMTADDVKALWSGVAPEARPKSGADFGKLLVEKSLLTPFQAAEIIAGRGARLMMGDYTIVAQIGAGGMGQVYKAQHRRMKRTVALKVMSNAAMQDEAAVKRFQREVHAAARLEHPNIVTAYDSGESGSVKYLVMQFVDGGDLSDLVKKNGRLEIEQAVGYVIQAARGLAFAHVEGVIHRDIKPANLLLDKKGVVKILDMGLARFEDGGDGLTATEQVMGTVDYMSPEQAANTKGCDGRADIYSLGCTLWYLLTAKKLYEADTLIARLMLHRDGPLPSLVKERDDAPWPLEQALHKMIAKRAADRFQTMDEAIAALAPFGGAAAGGASGGSSPSVGQSADLASFMQSMGTGGGTKTNISATQIKPATNTNVDVTAQFTSPEVGTDPKSQVLAKSATMPKPQPATNAAKKPAKPGNNKTKLIAAGGALVGLALLAGIIVKIRDKDGNVVAEVNAPTGVSAEVITTPRPITTVKPIVPVTPLTPKSGATPSVPSFVASVTPSFVTPTARQTPPPADDYALKIVRENKVEAPNPRLDESQPFTVEAYITPGDVDPSRMIEVRLFGINAEFHVEIKENRWRFYSTHNDAFSPERFTPNRRVHVAGVRTKTGRQLFLDGKLVASKDDPLKQSNKESETPLLIEARGPIEITYDELRITQGIVYDKEFVPPAKLTADANTLALYHFDEGFGDVLKDSSGKGRDGKITSATWVKADGSPITTADASIAISSGTASLPAAMPPAAVRWPLAPTKPEEIAWLKSLQARLVLRKGTGGDRAVPSADPLPPGSWTVVGIELHRDSGPSLDDKALGRIAALTDLEILRGDLPMPGTKVTREGFQQLKSLVNLRELQLGRFGPPDSDPTILASFPQLETLKLMVTPLVGWEPHAPQSLRELTLYNTDDAKLDRLGIRPQMRELRFSGYQNHHPVRLAATKPFIAANPWCRVTFVGLDGDNGKQLIVEPTAPPPGVGRTIELLPLVDLGQDILQGEWSREGAGFVNKELKTNSWLRLPVELGEAYTLRTAFSTDSGNVSFVLPFESKGLEIFLSSKRVEACLKPLNDPTNPTANLPNAMNDAQRHEALFEVTRPSATEVKIAVSIDGALTLQWQGTRSQLQAIDSRRLLAPTLSVGSFLVRSSPMRLLEAQLTTTQGVTKPLRGTPAPPVPQASAPAATTGKLFMPDPGFAQWLQETKSKPAPEQLEAVSKKLMELNPGFDGKLYGPRAMAPPTVENGVVTRLKLNGPTITDLSPLQALTGLIELTFGGPGALKGKFTDLSSLRGLQLQTLVLSGMGNDITDLSPLAGMPLEFLGCREVSKLTDLRPLVGMSKLKQLDVLLTSVADLSPIEGLKSLETLVLPKRLADLSPLKNLKLTHLECGDISSLEPLRGMPLETLWFFGTDVTDFAPLYDLKTLADLRVLNAKNSAELQMSLPKALPNCRIQFK